METIIALFIVTYLASVILILIHYSYVGIGANLLSVLFVLIPILNTLYLISLAIMGKYIGKNKTLKEQFKDLYK